MSNQTRRQAKPKLSNAPSLLLSSEDNETLFSLLGRTCVTLATGIVQLYMAVPPQRTRWNKRFCGVVCFVKDNGQRSYFLRLFDIRKKVVLWEQEIYNQFKYKTPRDYFHTFEADDAQAGLNFADEDEAHKFKIAVGKKIDERNEKKEKRKAMQQQQQQPIPANNQPLTVLETNVKNKPKPVDMGTLKAKKSKEKEKGKKKLTKDDISQPTDFRHVGHVGWDPNKGLDMNNLDPDMRDLFQQVGIDDGADRETVDFIYDFVEQYGGIDAVKKDISSRPLPPPRPAGGAPLAPPPQLPPTQRTAARLPPTPVPKAVPPLPSRVAQAPQPPQPPSKTTSPPVPPINKPPAAAPPPPPVAPPPPPVGSRMMSGAPPPAPLPPAAPAIPAAPSAPSVPSVLSAPSDGKGSLLDEIMKGSSLKHLQEQETSHDSGDARGNLLDQIRGGATLKRVEHTENKPVSEEENVGIVGALARALATRQKHIQGSDEESNDSDDDDVSDEDEWDD